MLFVNNSVINSNMVVENKRKADESALVPAKKNKNEIATTNSKNKSLVQTVSKF